MYVHDLLVNCCGDYKRLCCSCEGLKIFIKVRIDIGLSRLKSETDAEILTLFVASLQDERLLTVWTHVGGQGAAWLPTRRPSNTSSTRW